MLITKYKIMIVILLLLSGCQNPKNITDKDFQYRESIFIKAKNHHGLIDLYRDVLKQKEDNKIRFKLAEVYYLIGNSKSSIYYLESLKSEDNDEVNMLIAKNLINLGENEKALLITNRLLMKKLKSAELHNLHGIALANNGNLAQARKELETARSLFLPEQAALNNLSVVAMLDERYEESVRLLLPGYLDGKADKTMLHNLIFSLVKMGDITYARKIIKSEGLSDNIDELLIALSKTDKMSEENK